MRRLAALILAQREKPSAAVTAPPLSLDERRGFRINAVGHNSDCDVCGVSEDRPVLIDLAATEPRAVVYLCRICAQRVGESAR